MASLTLKKIPEALLRELRRTAEKERRSLNQEIILLLERALGERGSVTATERTKRAQLAAWRKLAGKWESRLDAATEARRIMDARTSGRDVDL